MRNPAAQGRPDANQPLVVMWYEELMCMVHDTHKLGGGFPDLVVRIPTRGGGMIQLVEIKTEDGSLSPSQETFMRQWGGFCVAVIQTREDVTAHVQRVQRRFP